MIDVRQMRYFVALAETLHFGRAAERLHVSQPPVSRQVAALEKELGVKLIDRHTRQARLTPAGERFRDDARAVLAAVDQACRNARLMDAGELGDLRIGFMMHAAYSSIPPLARRYVAAHPQVNLQLRESLPLDLVQGVIDGEFDAGVGFSPGPLRGLSMWPIHEEALCLAVPAQHPLAAGDVVSVEALADEPLITVPMDVAPTLRQAIETCFRRAGLTPVVRLEARLQQSIVSLVAESLGIALVPGSLRRLRMPGVVFRDLRDAPVVEHVVLWRASNRNPALPGFLALAGAGEARGVAGAE